MTASPAPAPQKTEKGTRYVVFIRVKDSPNWAVVNSNVPAISANAAVKASLKAMDNVAGEYVAVPTRSWKPVKVTVSQETVVRLGDA